MVSLVSRLGLVAMCAFAVPLVTAGAVAQTQQPAKQAIVTYRKSALSIQTASGPQKFTVELALDDRQHEQGLMYRQAMAADAGMLFVYPQELTVRMWMKNTILPLDMVFIKADGTIGAIRERAVPQSLEIIPSGGPIKYVLELNGGTTARLGIKVGDKIDGEALTAQ